jgi:squalene-associated FAD-dependent desaturase
MTSNVHIIGAGMAGLAAGVHLAHLGSALTIYEAAPRAGGRCRSYHDPHLDCVIDNGNHLLMSGNFAVLHYLAAIGASDRLTGPAAAEFPFVDAATGARWTLRPGDGVVPWWIFDSSRRVPGTGPLEYLSALRLLNARNGATVTGIVGADGPLFRNFWEPLTVAALNTPAREAAAELMAPVLRETFLKGGHACRPLIAAKSLAHTFVDPAMDLLTRAGVNVRLGTRVRALTMDKLVTALDVDGTSVAIDPEDTVVLAVPPWIAETLVPGLAVPPPGEAIVNVHYRLPQSLGETRIVGVIGGCAHWVFAHGDLASVTISAAGSIVDEPSEDIAGKCWPDVAAALNLNGQSEPPSRVVKEKRATFAQTPAAIRRRPPAGTKFPNLLLAGDWTATGLPATIEGAVRSGFTAAAMVTMGAQARAA